MEKFGVLTKVDAQGVPQAHGYRYPNGSVKVRTLKKKGFYFKNPQPNDYLFGKDKFNAGAARSITITEGEIDTLSVYQLLGSKYPAVSVRGAGTARQDCAAEYEYLNSFEQIYLCFDNDEVGQRACAEVAGLFDFNKVFHVRLTKHKDANDYLQHHDEEEFKRIWWNAKRFLPEGIISSYSEVDDILDHEQTVEGATYPWPTLQDLSKGPHFGQIVLFTAQEGVGKTEIFRALEYHLLQTTDENLAIIHLEESKARLVKGLTGYDLQTPVHLDQSITTDQVKETWRKVTRRDNRVHIYSHFGSDDPDVILTTIRFLVAAAGCRYVFLDHLSQLVSGDGENDERKVLDYLSTKLAQMVEELDFCLFIISHVNDDGKTRGSRYIAKVADLHVQLSRDLEATDPILRNTTSLMIKKNRFAARTGPAGRLVFDQNSYTIREHPGFDLPPLENAA